MTNVLPDGYKVRPPSLEDAQEITDLIRRCDTEEIGEPDYTLEDVLQEWKREGFNLETDAWVVHNPQGNLVAYADIGDLQKTQQNMAGFVNSDYRGKGIGTYLLTQMQQRVIQEIDNTPQDTRVTLNTFISRNNTTAVNLLEKANFKEVRRYWRMEIEMKEPPQEASLPAGFQIRTFVKGQDDRAVYEAVEESFSDHWGHVEIPFEEWTVRRFTRYDFDPDLWYVATEGEEIVGYSLCSILDGNGWISTLGMRRKWRGKGIAKALLLHSFKEFYQRGNNVVRLGVDSQNLTGATRLYFSVGMKNTAEWTRFQKEIRAGKEISVQGL